LYREVVEVVYHIEIAIYFIFCGNFMRPTSILFSQILFDYGLPPAKYNEIAMAWAENVVKTVAIAPKTPTNRDFLLI
jgi:hypothetical protein